MSLRQIVLDTETTGLNAQEGHRIIEIGCLELVDRKLTGNKFHYYINPEREVDPGAFAVHGLSNEFLRDKPTFREIAPDFMTFILGAELIIHNAPFDVAFINSELAIIEHQVNVIHEHCKITDTLKMARQMHVGQRNSLDALCKRYSIDHSQRELHGALLDAFLLAQVYLAMTGGQGSFFDEMSQDRESQQTINTAKKRVAHKYELIVIEATESEVKEHEAYLSHMQTVGKCLWLE